MKQSSKIILRKVMNSAVTVFLVIILNFVLFRMMPGNPINTMVPNDPKIPEEYKLSSSIDEYGLDQTRGT